MSIVCYALDEKAEAPEDVDDAYIVYAHTGKYVASRVVVRVLVFEHLAIYWPLHGHELPLNGY